jgi:tape measure domain-containing protein
MRENQELKVNIIGDASSLNKSLGRAEGRLKKFSGSLTKTGRALTTRLTLPLAAVGTMAVKQAANFERLQTTLNVLTGSAEEGARAFERLVKFSAKTPFQLADLTKVNNTLMGFGLTTDEAFDSLSMLGDVAGIVGGDLQSIAIAFGQAAAEGRVMTRDLRQFINNGVPILQVLSEEMGVAEGAIMDMASEGKITFKLLDRAFKNATAEGGKFEGGMETLSKTLNGLFSTLKDNVNIALAELGQEIADALNLQEGIPALSRKIGDLITSFRNLDDDTQKFIINASLIAAAIPPITMALGVLISSIGTISTAVMALNPLISALIFVLGTLSTTFLTARASGISFGQTLKNLFKSRGSGGLFAALQAQSLAAKLQLDELKKSMDGVMGPLQKGESRDLQNLLFPNAKTSAGAKGPKANLSTTENEFKGLSASAASLHKAMFGFIESAGTGINTVVRPAIASLSPIITTTQSAFASLGEKSKETIGLFENFGASILPQVGQALADSFAAIADGENPIKRLITVIKALVVRLVAAAAAAAVLSFLLPGGGSGKAAKALSFVTTFKDLIGMRNGGLAFGQTPVMVGDYSGVRSNPEVIAPLNKLKAMIGGGSQNVSGEFVLRGQDLVVALQRAERNRNRFK